MYVPPVPRKGPKSTGVEAAALDPDRIDGGISFPRGGDGRLDDAPLYTSRPSVRRMITRPGRVDPRSAFAAATTTS